MRGSRLVSALVAMLALGACGMAQSVRPTPGDVQAPPGSAYRGELLYGNYCMGCHTSVVHVRSDHRAQTVSQVRGWVTRWAGELKLGWGAGEIGDVTRFLVRRYYKFDERSGETS